jgi:hypothetical protein
MVMLARIVSQVLLPVTHENMASRGFRRGLDRDRACLLVEATDAGPAT